MDRETPPYILECVSSLPPFPASVERLMKLAKQPDVEFSEIAQVVGTDQTLAARVLRAANSAFYGASRRVQTLRQATVMLGRETIFNVAMSTSALSVGKNLKEELPFDVVKLWLHNLAVAITSRELAKRLKSCDPEEAFIAGLLHDLGKIILLTHFGEPYAELLNRAHQQPVPLHVIEREAIEIDHTVAGEALCRHWKIPDKLARAVARHHEHHAPATHSLENIVRSANTLAKALRIGESGNTYVEIPQHPEVERNVADGLDLKRFAHTLPDEVRQAAQVFAKGAGSYLRGEASDETGTPSDSVVLVHISNPTERNVVMLLLSSLGHEPVASSIQAEAPPPVGIVRDSSYAKENYAGYDLSHAQVLEYDTWQKENTSPEKDFLNIRRLGEWLDTSLSRAAWAVT